MKKYFIILLVAVVVFVPVCTLAQGTTIGVQIQNPFACGSSCTLMDLIYAILNNIILPIAAVGVTMWIIYAGFTFLTAQGNPKKIEEAQQRLLWSLVGAGILLGAAGIAQVIRSTVGALIAP